MGQQRHFDRVRRLVSGYAAVPEAEIGLETRLVEDLGMDGDDADDFLSAFADAFGVDLSAMAPLNYFDDEGIGLPVPSLVPLAAALSRRFRDRVARASRRRRSVRVRDLVASARAGRWISPERRPPAHDRSWPGALFLLAVAALALWGLWRGASLALLAAAALLAVSSLRFLADLARLRRLDGAARFEEQAVSAGPLSAGR